MGVVAGQDFDTFISGDNSLRSRPMLRVSQPLESMGARFTYPQAEGFLPLIVHGGKLQYGELDMHVPSAQVKSAFLLAGVVSGCGCSVIDRAMTRNHSELMLAAMGAKVGVSGAVVSIGPDTRLNALDMRVPGDISSGMFFAAAAAMLPGSEIVLEGVGINPGRTGLLKLLREMGAEVEISSPQSEGGEDSAVVTIRSGELRGISVGGSRTVSMIDELPLLAVLASQAEGVTEVRGASELRVKESDRIAAIAMGIRAMGGEIEELEDGFIIAGPQRLRGAAVESHGDHRIAMALAVGALAAEGGTVIGRADAVAVSFPRFWELLAEVAQYE
jgi:3-phosphoshikimate 1-carboxyvinyltransferase